ncbi:hypothetical protein ACO0QE_002367 [Hanseniaspora vineae]
MTIFEKSEELLALDIEQLELSQYYTIKKTSYGGRAVFASVDIPKGTRVLCCEKPLAHSINIDFKKECCYYCFSYFADERSLKFKILECDLWFCSEKCLDKFEQECKNKSGLFETFKELKTLFSLIQKKKKVPNLIHCFDDDKINPTTLAIEESWDKINSEWIPSVDKLGHNNNKKLQFLNLESFTEQEYTECRYVFQCLTNLVEVCSKNTNQGTNLQKLFMELQSNELETITGSPHELFMHLKVFKICYVVLAHTKLSQKIKLSTKLFRHIMGSESANSFGIWEIDENLDSEDREFLGTSLYPEASYFNHSCFPNIDRKRDGSSLNFTTNMDVKKNEQLCVQYGGLVASKMPFQIRQQQLYEKWYFKCLCISCEKEKTTMAISTS